jgi:glycosyltransferase involved in cell wall biosynthesis
MRAAVREFRPDLLHVQCFSGNGVYATLLSIATRTPLIVTLQGETFMDDHDVYARSIYLRTGLRAGLRRATQVTGCSQFTLDDAAGRFDPAAIRGHVIFNGVDLAESPRGNWLPPFERFVLGLGRVVHRKGFDLLIEAFARIAEQDPDLGLVIGGDGPDLPRLRALADDRSLRDRVFFAGVLSRTDVGDAMRAAEAFVMPSRVEAFGMVVLEAWKAGTPAIVTANGGPPEFVRDGVDGLVVDPLDVEALAEQLGHLLGDRELRRRLAAEGTARLPEFAWPEIARQYEDVYVVALGA